MTFTVYSKDGCSYCTKVIQVLQLAELKYVEYKLGRDYNVLEFYEMFGKSSTFPKVRLNEKTIGGCMETVQYLREQKLV
tara:strand:+ start:131 stop:367 length:237 start_codon:yes stop_codon:yes gene_type:complete